MLIQPLAMPSLNRAIVSSASLDAARIAFDVVAIVVGLAERRHLRGARQDVVKAAQRRQHQRVGIRELLRLDGELHLVEQQLVRNPVLTVQSLGVQRLQARKRRALARVLAFERGERQVRQQMVVARNPADGRLDRIAPERRVEVVVQQDFELCCCIEQQGLWSGRARC